MGKLWIITTPKKLSSVVQIVLLKPILSDIHKYLHQIKMVLVYLPPIVKYRWFSKILITVQ